MASAGIGYSRSPWTRTRRRLGEGTFDLDEGTYVLFCNILEEEDDGTFESAFQEGMSTTFTVDG